MDGVKLAELNARERTQYIVAVAGIENLENFSKSDGFAGLLPEHKKYLRTAITYLVKFRETAPKGLSKETCHRLLRGIKDYHLSLEYKGADRIYVKGEELDKLMEYAVMGMCRDCTLTGKAAERCPFKREWQHQLQESDCPTGDCPYSFSFDKNKAWGDNNERKTTARDSAY